MLITMTLAWHCEIPPVADFDY